LYDLNSRRADSIPDQVEVFFQEGEAAVFLDKTERPVLNVELPD
jgi:hypothetical protein